MNNFDLVVVLFSLLEITLDVASRVGKTSMEFFLPLSVLRAFRILRLFKLVKSVKSMRKVLSTLAESFSSIIYLGALLILMILIFALLGMELFGGFYPRAPPLYPSTPRPFYPSTPPPLYPSTFPHTSDTPPLSPQKFDAKDGSDVKPLNKP